MLSKKVKRGILAVLAVMLVLLLIDNYTVEHKEEIKEAVKQEQQIEQPVAPVEKEETKTEIQDEYLTEEDLPKEEQQVSNIDAAYELAKPFVDNAFGPTGLDYSLRKETADGVQMLVLVIDISEEEIAATDMNTWNMLKDGAIDASRNMKTLLNQRGYYDIHFAIMIGDVSRDAFYLMVGDGEVVTDIPNGVY